MRGSTRTDVAVFAIALGSCRRCSSSAWKRSPVWRRRRLRGRSTSSRSGASAFLAALQLVRLFDPERPIALLLPMIPAGIAALAYMRWRPFRSFLSISLVLPLLGLLAFRDDGSAGRRRSARDGCRGAVADTRRLGGLRRISGELASAGGWVTRRRAVSELRALGSRERLVPAGNDCPCLHHPGCPGDSHRTASPAGTAADTHGSSHQPVHAARRAVLHSRRRAGHAPVPGALLPADTRFSCVPGPRAWPPLRHVCRIPPSSAPRPAQGPAATHRSAVGWFRQCAR